MRRLTYVLVVVATAVLLFAVAGCGTTTPVHEAPPQDEPSAPPRVVQPGAPGQPSRTIDATASVGDMSGAYTVAEVRFMQDMMHHHAQAVEMGALVEERTDSEAIRLLARRIAVSQDDEMAQMRKWLEDRNEAVPALRPTIDPHAGHGHHDHAHHGDQPADHDHAGMPGMLSPEQMQQLADARGEQFDRLFLEFMIMHHEGALIMVEQLFQTEGAGQQTETFSFASHVDSDQRIEILRMRRMLEAMNQSANH